MKKKYFFIVFVLSYITSVCQNPGFVPAPSFPPNALGRDDASFFVINEKAYVGLGLREGFSLGNDFYVFDAVTNAWQPITEPPFIGRQYAASFSLNGQGYIVGGISDGNVRYNDVWKYDPSNDTWVEKNSFPGTKRYAMQSAVWNSNAYLFFGRDSTGFLKEVWKYNGISWSQLSNFPSVVRYQSAHAQWGSKVYFVCGYDSTLLTNEVWQFDLLNESWTQLADFPGEARWYGRGFSYGSKIYIGTGWATTFLNDFWSFDVVSETWAQAPSLPDLGRKGIVAFNLGGRAFVGLGVDTDGERTNKFWEFVLNVEIKENEALSLNIYPNPATDFICVDASEINQALEYKIIDVSGKELRQGIINPAQTTIETAGLANGIYHLFLSDGMLVNTQKFCIQRP